MWQVLRKGTDGSQRAALKMDDLMAQGGGIACSSLYSES